MKRVWRWALIVMAVVGGIGTAAPAQAYTSQDTCTTTLYLLSKDEIEKCQDNTFRTLLEDDGVLFSFNLEKRQGQHVCDLQDAGMRPVDAVYELMRDGGYPWDIANSISPAATVAYCWYGY
jgi:hypothetical protein